MGRLHRASLLFLPPPHFQLADLRLLSSQVGRVFAGLGVGCVSCLVPQYQSEVAPKKIRGLVVGMYQLAVTLGLVLAAVVDNATKDRPDHSACVSSALLSQLPAR